jgi:O-antigen/teichoic acid export membrane protein
MVVGTARVGGSQLARLGRCGDSWTVEVDLRSTSVEYDGDERAARRASSAMTAGHGAGMRRNTVILIVGTLVPTVIGLVTVPAYLSVIGQARFGVYVIVGLVIAYFALLDRGLNAAVQNEVARLDPKAADARAAVVWAAVVLNAVIGVIAGAGLLVIGWLLFGHVLSLSGDLRAESIDALPALAACVPLSTVLAVFQGGLIGRERFGTVAVLDGIRMTALQLLPLAFAYWWGPELVWLALGLLAATGFSTVCYFTACLGVALAPRLWARPSRVVAARLFHYGKWVTVTSVLSPLLDMSDRMVIATIRGPTAVTIYSIPYNLASRLLIIPFSLIRVAFPRFSAIGDDDSRALGGRALAGLAALTAPLAVLGATLAAPFLELWIGGDVARNAAPIAAVLFAGVWVNGLGYVPYTLLQARGRPDLPARFHALEFVPFLIVLAIGVKFGGPLGAAVAWSSRVLFDTALLLTAARLTWLRDRRLLATSAIVGVAAVNGAVFGLETAMLIGIGIPLVILSLVAAWRLSPADFHAFVGGRIRRRRSSREGSKPASTTAGHSA